MASSNSGDQQVVEDTTADDGPSLTIDNTSNTYLLQVRLREAENLLCGVQVFYIPPAGDVTHTVTPCPIYDSRTSKGGPGDVGANQTRTIDVIRPNYSSQGGDASDCGIPASARGLVVAVEALNSSTDGNIRVWPNGEPTPAASVLAFTGGTRGSIAIPIEIGANESVKVRNGGASSTSIRLTVVGYLQGPA